MPVLGCAYSPGITGCLWQYTPSVLGAVQSGYASDGDDGDEDPGGKYTDWCGKQRKETTMRRYYYIINYIN